MSHYWHLTHPTPSHAKPSRAPAGQCSSSAGAAGGNVCAQTCTSVAKEEPGRAQQVHICTRPQPGARVPIPYRRDPAHVGVHSPGLAAGPWSLTTPPSPCCPHSYLCRRPPLSACCPPPAASSSPLGPSGTCCSCTPGKRGREGGEMVAGTSTAQETTSSTQPHHWALALTCMGKLRHSLSH